VGRRVVVLATVCLLTCAPAARATRAAGPDDGRAVAQTFMTALFAGDGKTACSLLSPAFLARVGGEKQCVAGFSEGTESSADDQAQESLVRAYAAARASAERRRGYFTTKKFHLRDLARAIERIDPHIDVVLGKGPNAAAGRLVTTVVLDTRSGSRRVVFYAESDDGSIWRLSAGRGAGPQIDEVGTGVPETNAPPPQPTATFTIDSVAVVADSSLLVRITLHGEENGQQENYGLALILVPAGDSYLVDDILLSVGQSG
jgi:hypothetical protein